jgi:hypothetical protein
MVAAGGVEVDNFIRHWYHGDIPGGCQKIWPIGAGNQRAETERRRPPGHARHYTAELKGNNHAHIQIEGL